MPASTPLVVEFVYGIEIENIDRHETLISDVLQQAAELEGIGGEVVVSIVDDERIRELNREYRGKDVSTDVLSFPMLEAGVDEPAIFWDKGADESGESVDDYSDQQLEMLGDIVVSWPTAKRQAEEYGHTQEREVAFLTLHGLLHLYGYDHENDADEEVMFARQREVMNRLGLARE